MIQSSTYARFREIVGGIFGKQGKYTTDVLVVYHADDNVQMSIFLVLELLHDVLDTCLVVTGVAKRDGGFLYLLPTSH